MSNVRGWVGVDLDGTLAHYDGWKGVEHIGAPIPRMVERVKRWIAEGKDVRIFTSRVAGPQTGPVPAQVYIEQWCREHLGVVLPITATKDHMMIELWDDRCVQVIRNTGARVVQESASAMRDAEGAMGNLRFIRSAREVLEEEFGKAQRMTDRCDHPQPRTYE